MNESQLFADVLKLASSAERAAYLDATCAGNPKLRADVEALLRAHATDPAFLESPASLAGSSESPPTQVSSVEHAGLMLAGRYKLLEPIGEGGMGTVWLAQQMEPVKRQVALKLIKAGMSSKAVLARFETERQALALMDHPNIAKVLDAGTAPDTRPFFVMELVKGVPITKYCDERRLTPRQRLELFAPVCHAIQHAHQKGIIHRDIKPSNVLVALYDDRPVPKVIDFGVAKATGQQLTEETLHTGFGAVVGTLEYMSPEQAGFNQLDVDTRSDIYSLGVLLYELLTGGPPFGRRELEKAGVLEMLRVIREQEPSKPSAKLSTSEGLPTVAANRGTEPARLTRLVRGELDWIVMKALEKQRSRRYDTANALAMDLQRYLADEPVQAGPPSATYRLRKFVRRNKGPMLAACLVLLVLILGIAGTTTGMVRAQTAERQANKERDIKEQARLQTREALNTMTDEVVEDLLGRQAELNDQHQMFLRKVLAYHEAFAAAEADDPAGLHSRIEAYARVAVIRRRLGEFEEAETAYREGLACSRQLAEAFPDQPDHILKLASSYHNLGNLLRETGRSTDAQTAYGSGLAIQLQLVDRFPGQPIFRQQLIRNYLNLGILLYDVQGYAEAEQAYQNALMHFKRLPDDAAKGSRREQAVTLMELGSLLGKTGRPEQAQAAYEEAIAIKKQLMAEFRHQSYYREDLAVALNNWGQLLWRKGDLQKAEDALREALAIQRQLAADFPTRPDHRQFLARSYYILAIVLRFAGRSKESESAFSESISINQRLVADFPRRPDHRKELGEAYHDFGPLLRQAGRLKEAEEAYRQAVGIFKQLTIDFPAPYDFRSQLASATTRLMDVLVESNQIEEAKSLGNESLTFHKQLVKDFPDRDEFRADLAQAYLKLGKFQASQSANDAEATWREALTILEPLAKDFPNTPKYQNDLAGTLVNLASLHNDRREFVEAIALLEQAGALNNGPGNVTSGRYWALATSYRGLMDHVRAAATADELVRFGFDPNGDNYNAACLLCHCVRLAAADSKLDEQQRKEQSRQYADRAMALLRQAIERGFRDAAHMKQDPDLAPIRSSTEFQKALADLEGKKEG